MPLGLHSMGTARLPGSCHAKVHHIDRRIPSAVLHVYGMQRFVKHVMKWSL